MKRVVGIALCVLAVSLVACGDDDSAATGDLTVFAAASLTDAFTEIANVFTADNPDANLTFNFAGSSALAEQINAGNPADVFASADTGNMDKVTATGSVTASPATFAHNLLAIATPPGNPGNIEGLADFADDSLLIGLCAPEVPCGKFALQALTNAGVTPSVDTNEPDVRSLLTKIEADELDAGIVYVTDVQSSNGSVDSIDIPDGVNVQATYVIAPVAAGNAELAEAFVAFVLSTTGQDILASYGFGSP